jgi:hypothetical protein
MFGDTDRRSCIALGALLALACVATADAATAADTERNRQALDDAWFTGPILAASANTLPQGHMLIEPYVYDVVTHGRFDEDGNYREADTQHTYGSLTYLLYGVTDTFTVGAIPTFGFNNVSKGEDSSKIGVGDLTLQAQYRLTQFRESGRVPTLSLLLQQSLPTGKHDQLGTRLSDGMGSGAYATTLGVHSQYYFWLPNARILRTRLNVTYTLPQDADVTGTSVYGTPQGFSGEASPGDSFAIYSSWEYSITREWVVALDVVYQHDDNTRVSGFNFETGTPFEANSGSSWRVAVAPAIEYNWTSRVGVIVGARWFPAGRNTSASVTPVAAINIVY